MTQDIILETTVSFIRANERNLQLAFQVEKALPEVRSELIKEFFECTEKQLKENVKAEEEWEIRVIDMEALWIRKTHWEILKHKEGSEDWWGVGLTFEKKKHLYITVTDISETSDRLREQIKDEFIDESYDESDQSEIESDESEIYYCLGNELPDLNGLDFLKKMLNDKEREEITKDLADKLAKLAVAVDGIISNPG